MRIYRGLLIGAMRARWLTILVTIGLFAAALFAIRFVPRSSFRPPIAPSWWST